MVSWVFGENLVSARTDENAFYVVSIVKKIEESKYDNLVSVKYTVAFLQANSKIKQTRKSIPNNFLLFYNHITATYELIILTIWQSKIDNHVSPTYEQITQFEKHVCYTKIKRKARKAPLLSSKNTYV